MRALVRRLVLSMLQALDVVAALFAKLIELPTVLPKTQLLIVKKHSVERHACLQGVLARAELYHTIGFILVSANDVRILDMEVALEKILQLLPVDVGREVLGEKTSLIVLDGFV